MRWNPVPKTYLKFVTFRKFKKNFKNDFKKENCLPDSLLDNNFYFYELINNLRKLVL